MLRDFNFISNAASLFSWQFPLHIIVLLHFQAIFSFQLWTPVSISGTFHLFLSFFSSFIISSFILFFLSISLSHTHTHYLSFSFFLSLSVCMCASSLSLSLSLWSPQQLCCFAHKVCFPQNSFFFLSLLLSRCDERPLVVNKTQKRLQKQPKIHCSFAYLSVFAANACFHCFGLLFKLISLSKGMRMRLERTAAQPQHDFALQWMDVRPWQSDPWTQLTNVRQHPPSINFPFATPLGLSWVPLQTGSGQTFCEFLSGLLFWKLSHMAFNVQQEKKEEAAKKKNRCWTKWFRQRHLRTKDSVVTSLSQHSFY